VTYKKKINNCISCKLTVASKQKFNHTAGVLEAGEKRCTPQTVSLWDKRCRNGVSNKCFLSMKWLQGPWPVMFSNYTRSSAHKYHHSFSHTMLVLLSISQQAVGTCVCGTDENKSKSCLAVTAQIILCSSGLSYTSNREHRNWPCGSSYIWLLQTNEHPFSLTKPYFGKQQCCSSYL